MLEGLRVWYGVGISRRLQVVLPRREHTEVFYNSWRINHRHRLRRWQGRKCRQRCQQTKAVLERSSSSWPFRELLRERARRERGMLPQREETSACQAPQIPALGVGFLHGVRKEGTGLFSMLLSQKRSQSTFYVIFGRSFTGVLLRAAPSVYR